MPSTGPSTRQSTAPPAAGPRLHLAVELDGDGAHPAAWRRAAHPPATLLSPQRTRAVARVAENLGFTLATFEDGVLPPGDGAAVVGRIGAVERAAFAAVHTSVIGLAPVVATTYSEPFHVASQLASLDFASTGRAGWVVATTPGPEAALAYGRRQVQGEALDREAGDGVRVARALWDSWEDDAAIRDVATGRYLDRTKVHYIDFVGRSYSVKGPAIVPRPPQGQLVVFAPAGLLPPAEVDVELISAPDPAAIAAAAASATAARRFAEVEVVLDTPGASAAERLADLDAHAGWPTVGRVRYVGSPAGLVALLTELAHALDGVRLRPAVLDEDLPVLGSRVLPALFEAGLAARPVPGTSLRATLGLPRPASRFAVREESA